jgi:hexosaminidase
MAPAAALALSLLLAFLAIGPCAAADSIDLWPMPQSVSHGTQKLYVKKDITMSMVGSTYSDEKSILKDAFQRMLDLITLNHVIDGIDPGSSVLTCVNVVVRTPEDEVISSLDFFYMSISSFHLRIETSVYVDAFTSKVKKIKNW